MKNKFFSFSIMLLALIFIVAGCGKDDSSGSSSDTSENVKKTLKLGHPMSEETPNHKALVKLAETVSEKTDGNFKIDIYPNDILGSQRELIEGFQTGTTDMILSPATNISTVYPKLNIFNLPFLFQDKQHVYSVTDGEIGGEVYDGLRNELGIRTLGTFASGFRDLANSKVEVKTPDDVVGLKLRAIDSPINIDMLRAIGANAIPMAFGELYTGLQQGTVDGSDGPISNFYNSRFYEVQEYYTKLDLYFAVIMLSINEDVWNDLPEEYQTILADASVEAQEYERELLEEEEAEYFEAIIKEGVKVTELTPDQKELFQVAEQEVWKKYESIVGGKELIDKIVEMGK